MIESVVDEPFTCPNCGKSSDEHPTMDVSNAKTIFLCQDRAAKWQRVEPGTVIPAGQPYRVEYQSPGLTAGEYVPNSPEPVDGRYGGWFVDSSWKPPLVLPTEPTWGIAITPADHNDADGPTTDVGRWQQMGGILTRTHRDFPTRYDTITVEGLADFIPLTDEQVARIEAAR